MQAMTINCQFSLPCLIYVNGPPSDVNLATCYILLVSTYFKTSYNITYGRGPRTTVKVGGKLTTQAHLLFPVYAHHCTAGFSS